ncbi:MAG: aminotransferase class I/II-fold pyridoxal phosphate-dependent enzyme [Chitinophagaceae bacterium]
MAPLNRRYFLKTSGLAGLPVLAPFLAKATTSLSETPNAPASPLIKFYGDGEMFEPEDYLATLQKAQAANAIKADRYGAGGVVEALEKKFCEITGKEKAIFMPSGTMANQLAIAVLSGDNTKVFVQDTSHVYRDEADAAQSVYGKRLMPLAKNEPYFTAQQLEDSINNMPGEEVFASGIGAVSIENPVRRSDGRMVPLDEIKKISAYCRSKNIKLHLDGARIYMATTWTGNTVKEYAAYFDTVYISLYKYLGASGGAILCGDKAVIDKMTHLIKIHGGSMYGNWTNVAMALYRLEGLETRLQDARKRGDEIFAALNKLPGVKINALPGGTNIYSVDLGKNIDGKKLQQDLRTNFNIVMPRPNDNNQTLLTVNETLLYQPSEYVINAFKKSIT